MEFAHKKTLQSLPRLPLEGEIDLTYRCNNRCRHCWLWEPVGSPLQQKELTFDEIRRIVDEARAMGCQRWSISGGEPMLRPDFSEIFEYLTYKSVGYSLNTNGTLITPKIAQMLCRKGVKMVALYGATAKVYDHVTRHPDGFEMTMRGFRYLKEAGAGFTVQLIPMRDNWHQWDEMIALAQKLSPHWRVGASWLWLSQDHSAERNREIAAQRLPPDVVVALDKPDLSYEEWVYQLEPDQEHNYSRDDRLFAPCIETRRNFHIDPYGGMSWCGLIKDPSLRYDLRQGTFREAWEDFIPVCSDKVRGGGEWLGNCGICTYHADCKMCPVYAYLETGRYTVPIPYLCEVARETDCFKADWDRNHRRYFKIAGITVRVESDLDLRQVTFKDELLAFAVDGPGEDMVSLRHHFEIPNLRDHDIGEEVYRRVPWAISRKGDTWIYRGIQHKTLRQSFKDLFKPNNQEELHRLAVFNHDHTRGEIYSPSKDKKSVQAHGFPSLSLFPTDQIWLAPLLADRQAVMLHSSAAVINGKGVIFVGHSGAGKTTTMTLLKAAKQQGVLDFQILCDDRNIIRKWDEGWRVHGTWSHGDITEVSPESVPLQGIFFLEQAHNNQILMMEDRKETWRRLLATLIRPMVTAEWWNKELDMLEEIIHQIPCYLMKFEKRPDIAKIVLSMLE